MRSLNGQNRAIFEQHVLVLTIVRSRNFRSGAKALRQILSESSILIEGSIKLF